MELQDFDGETIPFSQLTDFQICFEDELKTAGIYVIMTDSQRFRANFNVESLLDFVKICKTSKSFVFEIVSQVDVDTMTISEEDIPSNIVQYDKSADFMRMASDYNAPLKDYEEWMTTTVVYSIPYNGTIVSFMQKSDLSIFENPDFKRATIMSISDKLVESVLKDSKSQKKIQEKLEEVQQQILSLAKQSPDYVFATNDTNRRNLASKLRETVPEFNRLNEQLNGLDPSLYRGISTTARFQELVRRDFSINRAEYTKERKARGI